MNVKTDSLLSRDLPTSASAASAPGVSALRGSFWRSRGGTILVQALIVLAVVVMWQFAAVNGYIERRLLSDPTDVAARMVSMLGGEVIFGNTIYEHVSQTLKGIVIGYILGCVLGVALGITFARWRLLASAFQPYILSVYGIPKIALAPLFMLFFGIGLESKVAVVTVSVFFLLFFTTYKGIVNVDPEFLNIARIMGASERRVFTRVIWPSALPPIFTGAKLAVPFAMVGAIGGEFVAALKGLGYLILQSTARYDVSAMFAGIVFLVIVVWGLGQLVTVAEGILLRWQPKRQRESGVSV